MLAPLLLLWPISIAVTNHVASNIANEPYDEVLAESVEDIAHRVRLVDGRIAVEPPLSAMTGQRADAQDAVYVQVRGPDGEVMAGDDVIGRPPADEGASADSVHFRDDRVEGEAIRVAYQLVPLSPNGQAALVQVAETRKKREALASRIISGVLLPQFAIIPLAVVLVWLGLSRGLRPLSRLRERMARRRPGDLSPLDIRRAPEELQPMVRSFNELMARLEENLHAQQRFIADAAHQMKTPLTGLRMQAELATRESDPDQLRRSIDQIALGAERAGHLIRQLLTLARAESSHEKLHRFEIVDLEAVARDATLEWVERARAKRIDLGFEGSDWPLAIDGVPLLLREMINNLLDNAIKFTSEGGRITVRLVAGENAMLEVEDNGIGVVEADRERVFERFYRVLGTDVEGSGLGLAICREIAEQHGGSIRLLAGSGGQGSRVVVEIPRAGTLT
ncbi:MAG TPA: sensor histidine kinase N-terminal domain-containing protein [Rhodocyclaceae bacterium]|nr:sensor histidine kinase N-terminal domain-containing protein [Rhodocyclaceae bacterium]